MWRPVARAPRTPYMVSIFERAINCLDLDQHLSTFALLLCSNPGPASLSTTRICPADKESLVATPDLRRFSVRRLDPKPNRFRAQDAFAKEYLTAPGLPDGLFSRCYFRVRRPRLVFLYCFTLSAPCDNPRCLPRCKTPPTHPATAMRDPDGL